MPWYYLQDPTGIFFERHLKLGFCKLKTKGEMPYITKGISPLHEIFRANAFTKKAINRHQFYRLKYIDIIYIDLKTI